MHKGAGEMKSLVLWSLASSSSFPKTCSSNCTGSVQWGLWATPLNILLLKSQSVRAVGSSYCLLLSDVESQLSNVFSIINRWLFNKWIPSLTRGLQGAISFAPKIYDEVICSLQGCTSNPPARTEKWPSPLWFTYLFYISYPTLSHHHNQWLFLLKFDFTKMLTFLLNEQVFQKKVTNSENSPPQISSDQDSSYLMDAQPVIAEINDSSEYINPEIHLVALKNWIG